MSSPPDAADPDFLALPTRTRAQIDATYSRALEKLFGGRASHDGRAAKRRRIGAAGASKRVVSGHTEDVDMDSPGGFLPDGGDGDDMGGFIPEDDDGAAGGFVLDEEGEGGFVPDEEDEDQEQDQGQGKAVGGGFLTESTSGTRLSTGKTSDRPLSGRLQQQKVPLSRIAALLAALRLPGDDDVLAVFRASATGWSEDVDIGVSSSRRRRGEEEGAKSTSDAQLGVERKDFRAVCAALMGGGGDDEGMEADEGEEGPLGDAPSPQFPDLDVDQDDEDDEEDDNDESEGDDFDPHGGSSLSSLSDESEYGPAPSRRRVQREAQAQSKAKGQSSSTPAQSKAKGKGKARALATGTFSDDDDADQDARPARRRKKKDDLVRSSGPVRLSAQQKEMVRALWGMLKPSDPDKAPAGLVGAGAGSGSGSGLGSGRMRGRGGAGAGQSANVLGRDEVKAWVRQLGEMWTDDEIGDMVSLFSTQHEGRGLSYDDFSQVMVRARIV